MGKYTTSIHDFSPKENHPSGEILCENDKKHEKYIVSTKKNNELRLKRFDEYVMMEHAEIQEREQHGTVFPNDFSGGAGRL